MEFTVLKSKTAYLDELIVEQCDELKVSIVLIVQKPIVTELFFLLNFLYLFPKYSMSYLK